MSPDQERDIYKDFFDRIHDLVYRTNNDNIITLANPAFAKIFGYESEQDIIGTDIRELYVDPEGRDKLLDALKRHDGYVTGHIKLVKKNTGERFYLSVDSHIITDEEGKEVGIEGIGRGVTERETQLQRIIEEQDRFMEDISHEIRTPIATILATAENMQKGIVPTSDQPKVLKKIVTELQRLNLLAQRFWRAELIRKGKLECQKSKVDVYERIAFCKTLLTSLAERKSISIEIDNEIKKWSPQLLDREMFQHAIFNLIDNAIKYSYPGTFVKVYGNQRVDSWQLVVQNRGIEIEPEEIELIFQRYYRTKRAISMSPSGSGIGLLIVKDFVDNHGAKVEVKSEPIRSKSDPYLNSFSLIFPK